MCLEERRQNLFMNREGKCQLTDKHTCERHTHTHTKMEADSFATFWSSLTPSSIFLFFFVSCLSKIEGITDLSEEEQIDS